MTNTHSTAQVVPFQFEGSDVRVIDIDGEPWFVAADIARVLEYRMASDMTRRLDDIDKGYAKVRTPSGDQQMTVISESGLYDAVFRSNAEGAKPFRRWVTADVLPTIRKTGRYGEVDKHQELPAIPQNYAEALRAAAENWEEVQRAKEKIAELEPKAEYWNEYVADHDVMRVATVASTLGLRESELRTLLIEHKWIYKETTTRWSASANRRVAVNRYSEYATKKHYFRRVEKHEAPRFRGEVMHTLKITPAGAEAIARLVKRAHTTTLELFDLHRKADL